MTVLLSDVFRIRDAESHAINRLSAFPFRTDMLVDRRAHTRRARQWSAYERFPSVWTSKMWSKFAMEIVREPVNSSDCTFVSHRLMRSDAYSNGRQFCWTK